MGSTMPTAKVDEASAARGAEASVVSTKGGWQSRKALKADLVKFRSQLKEKLPDAANKTARPKSAALACASHESFAERRPIFYPFTDESLRYLDQRELQLRNEDFDRKHRSTEAKLVDGELKYYFEGMDEEHKPEDNPALRDGVTVPSYLGECPKKLLYQPLEEIDMLIKHKYYWALADDIALPEHTVVSWKTFVVVSKRNKSKCTIFRFSASNALFVLSPLNPIRRLAIRLLTHRLFELLIFFTIVANCIYLAFTPPITTIPEYVFMAIYTWEMIIKVCARGFFMSKHTYLRDPWNWLDFLVVLSSYVTTIIDNLSVSGANLKGIRTLRVFRALKAVSIVPGLRTIVRALLKSMVRLVDVLVLIVFFLFVGSLFGMQLYMGSFRHKCVLAQSVLNLDWPNYILAIQTDNRLWLYDAWYTDWQWCGNATGARPCPPNYVCMGDIGDNPDSGFNNFDSIGYALMAMLQLLTNDYWDSLFNKVMNSNGPWNIFFFIITNFFGAFYLINLMLAVSALSYQEAASSQNQEDGRSSLGEVVFDPTELRLIHLKRPKLTIDKLANKIYRSHMNLQLLSTPKLPVTLAPEPASVPAVMPKQQVPNGNAGDDRKLAFKLKGKVESVDSAVSADSLQDAPPQPPSRALKSALRRTPSILKTQRSGLEDSGIVDDTYSVQMQRQSSIVGIGSQEELLLMASMDRNCRCCLPYFCACLCCEYGFKTSDREEAATKSHKVRSQAAYKLLRKVQHGVYLVATDPFFEFIIIVCILLNTLAMAVTYYNMPPDFATALDRCNYFFTGMFTLEAILKIIAFSKQYFLSNWNLFDLLIVIASLADITVSNLLQGSTLGLSVIRAFRLLRIFKLAQSWKTMRILLSIIFSTLGSLGYMTVVLLIAMFMLAVMGMTLFSTKYSPDNYGGPVRWGFQDFFHSMMLVFRVLCAEHIQPMSDCIRVADFSCMVVFFSVTVFGNMMMLNLFLALLLNAFGMDQLKALSESSPHDERLIRRYNWLRRQLGRIKAVLCACRRRRAVQPTQHQLPPGYRPHADGKMRPVTRDLDPPGRLSPVRDSRSISAAAISDQSASADSLVQRSATAHPPPVNAANLPQTNVVPPDAFKTDRTAFVQFPATPIKRPTDPVANTASNNAPAKYQRDATSMIDSGSTGSAQLVNCCCDWFYRVKWARRFTDSDFADQFTEFRQKMNKIVSHRIFDGVVLVLIVVSSATMCLEDTYIDERPALQMATKILNYIFTGLFTIEMLIKWVALGFKKYFTSFWTILDFLIVMLSLTGIIVDNLSSSNLGAFRALRTLRALRPLRAISRWQGMRIVVNALVYAIPAIVNVMLVVWIFWLIFSIMGVQFFGGKFQQCQDNNGNKLPSTAVKNMTDCLNQNYTWTNPLINFDNVINGYLALFQVATFEGWMDVFANAVDTPQNLLDQPIFENGMGYYIYFVIFVIVGRFLMLNLFIGVIIDNFNALKKKYDGSYLDIFLTDSQKHFYQTMRKLGNRKPQRSIKRPTGKFQGSFYDIATSSRFELAIMILILINMLCMAVEHYKQEREFTDVMKIANVIFTTFFALEAFVKIVGLRWHYFRRAWNCFDFIIVVLSIAGIALEDLLANSLIKPSLLRVIRVFRIGRVLRLVKSAKGVRKLLFSLLVSLPALFNIGALLFLIMFIYAIVGITLFSNIVRNNAFNEVVNFETFANSIVLLFRLSIAPGWNDILAAMSVQPPNCNDTFRQRTDGSWVQDSNGECGYPLLASLYLVTYIFVAFFVIINMYIAIILDNFNLAHQQEEIGITEDDIDMFYVTWEKFDPTASQFMNYRQLSDFVGQLEPPMGIPKPNEAAIVAFDLPIYVEDKVHCLDVLMGMIKRVLGGIEDTEEFRMLRANMEAKYQKEYPNRANSEIISTTVIRKKQDIAARTLQRAWRKHKMQVKIQKIETGPAKGAKQAGGDDAPGRPSRPPSGHTIRSRVSGFLGGIFKRPRSRSPSVAVTVDASRADSRTAVSVHPETNGDSRRSSLHSHASNGVDRDKHAHYGPLLTVPPV